MTRQTARDRQVYDLVWRTVPDRPPSDTFVDMAGRMLRDTGRQPILADLGCGGGRHAVHAARAGIRVTAIDHSTRAVERAVTLAAGLPCDVVEGDAFDWLARQETAALDGVVCFDAIHHLSSDAATVTAALAELRRVVRPDGYILVTILSDIEYSSGERPPGRLWVTADDARRILAQGLAGTEVIRIKQRPVLVPATVSVDATTGELRDTTYTAQRVLWFGRVLP